jgi:hypothetical protein
MDHHGLPYQTPPSEIVSSFHRVPPKPPFVAEAHAANSQTTAKAKLPVLEKYSLLAVSSSRAYKASTKLVISDTCSI